MQEENQEFGNIGECIEFAIRKNFFVELVGLA